MAAILKAALAYGCFGWPVLPCNGEVPAIAKALGGSGYLTASTDPETIERWWTNYPDANIGVSCIGAGFLVIDIDPRDGGDRTSAELCADRPLPHTPRQISGGGGSHILFAKPNASLSPKGALSDCVRAELGDGVQIKLKGHIVVAPSIHPDTGRAYAWETGFWPSRTPLASIPTWLSDLIVLPPAPKGAARPVIEEEAGWGPAACHGAPAPLSSAPARRSNGHPSASRRSPLRTRATTSAA